MSDRSTRLDRSYPDLAEAIRNAPVESHRRIAAAAAEAALRATEVSDARLFGMIARVDQELDISEEERAYAADFADVLDDVYLSLETNAGDAAISQRLKAFVRARAATAAAATLLPNPTDAAFEATYEAAMAIDDVATIRQAVLSRAAGWER